MAHCCHTPNLCGGPDPDCYTQGDGCDKAGNNEAASAPQDDDGTPGDPDTHTGTGQDDSDPAEGHRDRPWPYRDDYPSYIAVVADEDADRLRHPFTD